MVSWQFVCGILSFCYLYSLATLVLNLHRLLVAHPTTLKNTRCGPVLGKLRHLGTQNYESFPFPLFHKGVNRIPSNVCFLFSLEFYRSTTFQLFSAGVVCRAMITRVAYLLQWFTCTVMCYSRITGAGFLCGGLFITKPKDIRVAAHRKTSCVGITVPQKLFM